ncbi:MAG TPA: PDZ domain-containing protein [Pirellulales bacterium]|nr:PDZ domain-containing protein [Pirellulales bacterium]
MRLLWFRSLVPISASAVLGLLVISAPAQGRDDSQDSDSSKSSDNDRSSSRDSDRSDQGGRSSRGDQTSRQTGHAMLGVTFYNDQSAPLEIRRVLPGSPAEEAGLERGDEILSVDGHRVSSVQQLRQRIDRAGTDEDVELGVLRDGRRRTVEARLTANQQSSWSQQQGWNRQSFAGNRNRQGGNEGQYGNQGQSFHSPEYEQGYWDGYERAQQELAQGRGNRGQEFASRGYQSQGYGNQGFGNQGYGTQGYASQGYGSQSYQRGSRGAGNWQEEGYRGSRGGNQAFLGVTLDENDRDTARVSNVYPNSPAEEAGIRSGDEIVSIDDEDVNSSRDVRRILGQKDVDDDVSIEVQRGGRQRTLQATLGSQQEFLTSQNQGSYRMGRRTGYGGQSSDSSSRRRQNSSSDDDEQNDNY